MFVYLLGKEKIVGKLTNKKINKKKHPLWVFFNSTSAILKVDFRT